MQFAPNWFVEEFRSNVLHIYQSQGFLLKPTVQPEGSINGKTVKWPWFGTFEMQERSRASETPPANPDQDMLSATLKDYDALYEIFEQDLTKMTANEKQAAHQAGGMAVGRCSDRIILNAMNGASGLTTIGNGTGDWDLFQAIGAAEALQNDDLVPRGSQINCVVPYRWFDLLMLYKEFNSSEWVGSDLGFPAGVKAKRWRDVNWIPMSTAELIVPSANQCYGFIYDRTAVGFATNYEGKVTPDWDNRKGCWTMRIDTQATAMTLRPNARGLRRLHFATNTALQRPVERTVTVA